MSKYTIEDVANIVPENLTTSQIEGVEAYLNEGVIPPYDPCVTCEPNFIRKLISLIQVAERTGYFPPKREVATTNESEDDIEPFNDMPEGYKVGDIPEEELERQRTPRPELYGFEEGSVGNVEEE